MFEQEKKSATVSGIDQKSGGNNDAIQLQDNRPKSVVQKKSNNTGLPDNLKSGIENLSGHSMDDVKVHYNSDKPAQLNAHAYAQGTEIHIASGQEKHLAHEAWHVVQQKQGRVQPTMQMKGKVNINDDEGLEKEADVMGAKALQMKKTNTGSNISDSGIVHKKSVIQRGKKDGLLNAGTIRAGADLVGSITGLVKPDPGKPRTVEETGGKAVKAAGSALKLGAKTLVSEEAEGMFGAIGTNFKATGEDISEAGKTKKDKNATKAKKVVTETRAVASVTATVSETTRETLKAFGIEDEAVPLSVVTLISDSVKAFSFGHDFYEVLHNIYSSYSQGKMIEQLWSNAATFFQKVGSFSMAALRAVALWERLNGKFEEYYLKLMPLGKSLLNFSTAMSQAKAVYDDYHRYQALMNMAKGAKKRKKGNLELLVYGKWDQLMKGLIEVVVSVGETIYWAGKYFVAIKGVSALVGAGSKVLKTTSVLFTSFNVRQVARDYLPAMGGYLVDKNKTSDKLAAKRKNLIAFLRGNSGDKKIQEAIGMDASKIADQNYMEGLVARYV